MKKFIQVALLCCLIASVMLLASACGEDKSGDTTTTTAAPASSTAPTTVPSTSPSTNPSTDPSTPDSDDNSTTAMYTITAYDAFGAQLEETVVVEIFTENGSSLGIVMMKNGTMTRELDKGYYTFEISPVDMDSQFYYDASLCQFTPEDTQVNVSLYNYANDDDRQVIYAYDESVMDHVPHNAVQLGEGGTYVSIENPSMTYFIFTPTRGGIYRVSYISSKSITIGYFGSPHNVLRESASQPVDGAIEIEVKNEGVQIGNQGGTTQLVIGVRSYAVKNCVIMIERVGDATVDMPWTDVQADRDAVKVDNCLNSEFVDFDVTNSELKVVYSEADGYYHLNTVDGPIIYVRITTALVKSSTSDETIYAFLPSFVSMCETDRLGKVFYDESGKTIIMKKSYNDMFMGYANLCGTMGLYPLNQQLAQAIKDIGDHKGWFDFSTEFHIFGDMASSVVKENAWLFACCYEVEYAKGTQEKPASVTPSSESDIATFAVQATKGEAVYVRTIANATLTIVNAEGIKVVANDGTEYVADSETGRISVVITANQNFTIVYDGELEETVIHFNFVEYFN